MKTAHAQPIAWTITCPYCGEPITQDGSQMIDLEYGFSVCGVQGVVYCFSCGKTAKVPASVEKELK